VHIQTSANPATSFSHRIFHFWLVPPLPFF
jgi:hypothetical protein